MSKFTTVDNRQYQVHDVQALDLRTGYQVIDRGRVRIVEWTCRMNHAVQVQFKDGGSIRFARFEPVETVGRYVGPNF